jgi:hypothetical protein
MPIKSKAQRRKFAELLVEGKIEPETYERWNREAGSAELPERVRPKKKARKRRVAAKGVRTKKKAKAKSAARKTRSKGAKKARKR